MNKYCRWIAHSLFVVLTTAAALQAQPTLIAGPTMKTLPGGHRIVALKWFTEAIVNRTGVNIYRMDAASNERIKINASPVERLSSTNTKFQDTAVAAFVAAAEDKTVTDPEDIESRDLLMIVGASYNNELARAIGIYYEDSTAIDQKNYKYEVRNTSDELIVTSEAIHVVPPTVLAAPAGLFGIAGNAKVQLKWEHEERFIVWNVYRSTSERGTMVKVNPEPVFLMTFPDAKGGRKLPPFFFTDTTVRNGETYYYTLKGVDALAVESAPSEAIRLIPHDMSPPPPLGKLYAKGSPNQVILHWARSTGKTITHYVVFRSNNFKDGYTKISDSLSASDTSFTDRSVHESGAYFYFVEVTNIAGTHNRSTIASIAIRDQTPPAIPVKIAARPAPGIITLEWQPNSEPDLKGYKVYRTIVEKKNNILLLTPKAIRQNHYIDTLPKTLKNKFFYQITALDTNYNESKQSQPVEVMLPDVTPPTKPLLKYVRVDSNGVTAAWALNTEKDVASYSLYRQKDSSSPAELVQKTGRLEKTLRIKTIPDGKFQYYLTATDSTGNVSPKSNRVTTIYRSEKSEAWNVTDLHTSLDTATRKIRLQWHGPERGVLYAVYRLAQPIRGDGSLDTSAGSDPVAVATTSQQTFEEPYSSKVEYQYFLQAIRQDGAEVDQPFAEKIRTP